MKVSVTLLFALFALSNAASPQEGVSGRPAAVSASESEARMLEAASVEHHTAVASLVEAEAHTQLHRALRGGGARARLAAELDRKKKRKDGSTLPVCVFLHGSGVDTPRTETVPSFPKYWGHFDTEVNHICQPKFIKYQSRLRGWDDATLLSEVCAELKKAAPKILVAHSMGNLVWSYFRQNPAACAGFDATQVKWVAIQGPFKGSVAATGCAKICASSNILWAPARIEVGCDCEGPKPHPALVTCETVYSSTSTGMTWAQHSAQAKNADYTMCGISPFTQLNVDSLGLDLIVDILPHAGVNWGVDNKISQTKPYKGTDGMVPFQSSCAGDISPMDFDNTPQSKRYAGLINHAAGTGRDGESASDHWKQPITFVKNALTALAKGL